MITVNNPVKEKQGFYAVWWLEYKSQNTVRFFFLARYFITIGSK